MAKSGRGQVPSVLSGGAKGGAPGGPKGSGPKGKSGKGGRASIAAARRSKGDKTQLIIGGVAIIVIVVVIAVGLVLHSRSTATQGAGYGTSTKSVAAMDANGVVTVQNNANGSPALTIDVYEDALCPICAEFEHQFGQQIAKAVDDGQLTVRYHMVAFLDADSHSGTYSTRAYGALMSIAKNQGSTPGLFMSYHTALYDAKNQPKEQGSSDLSDAQLAKLAGQVGASSATQSQISSGAEVAAAQKDSATNLNSLTEVAAKVGRTAGTPTVARNGVPLNINDTSWLTNLLPKSSTPSSAAPTS